MIFKDEMKLWYSDKEKLAKQLANKPERELMEYLEYRDIIKLKSVERPSVNTLGRLLFVPTYVLLCTICCFKWVFTGSFYIDSWAKKCKVIDKIMRYTGVG